MNEIIDKINRRVKDFKYLEFSIFSYSGHQLTIVGSQDILYYSSFEINFHNVFAIMCKSDWKADTTNDCITILNTGEEFHDFNLKYGVEVGFSIFKIISEDGELFFVIAEGISFVERVTRKID